VRHPQAGATAPEGRMRGSYGGSGRPGRRREARATEAARRSAVRSRCRRRERVVGPASGTPACWRRTRRPPQPPLLALLGHARLDARGRRCRRSGSCCGRGSWWTERARAARACLVARRALSSDGRISRRASASGPRAFDVTGYSHTGCWLTSPSSSRTYSSSSRPPSVNRYPCGSVSLSQSSRAAVEVTSSFGT